MGSPSSRAKILPPLLERLQSIEPDAEFTGKPPKITSTTGKVYYVKLGSPDEKEHYIGEAESLKAIHSGSPGLAPRVLAIGISDDCPYFISEYKEIGALSHNSAGVLGKRLATELHQYTSPRGYGFGVPTYCGATKLKNGWYDDWETCFDNMIGDLLAQLGPRGDYDSLCRKGDLVRKHVIPNLLGRLNIRPALLHGDLWSGNVGVDKAGEPVIFDPSSYFGHNEADLAIARIFGGFPNNFFETYHRFQPKSEPVDEYELRGDLYQLFHYLNHTVLFGGAYSGSAEKKMDILLRADLHKSEEGDLA
ncbi:fructosamine kinase PKL/CAK/FruK [Infundibulicybe gibba]|nr:fructosamine kinase PKL/CAK/FruK [Infundibulicybe gibba]